MGRKEETLEFTCAGWGCAQKLPDWAKGGAPVRANEPNLDCAQGLSENQARPHRGLPALRLNPGQSGLHALQDGLQVIKFFLGRQTALTVEPVHLRCLCGPDARVCCRRLPAGCRARLPRARWPPSGRGLHRRGLRRRRLP